MFDTRLGVVNEACTLDRGGVIAISVAVDRGGATECTEIAIT